MKKSFKFIFALMISMFLLIGTNFVSADSPERVEMIEGASIRRKTVNSNQGLRFYARINPALKDNEHGFYLVYGETTVETLRDAVRSSSSKLYLNDKEVFKVEVPGVTNGNEYSVVLTGIPEDGYFDSISVFPYVIINGIPFIGDEQSRSVADVALKMANSGENIDDIVSVDKIINTNRKRLRVDSEGNIEIISGLYELDRIKLKEGFINDWNKKFGANLVDINDGQFLSSATRGKVASGELTNTNLYKFFNDPALKNKWSWLLDLMVDKCTLHFPGTQAEAILGDGKGINLFDGEHLIYSIINFFEQEYIENYAAIDFSLISQYDDLKDYNNKVYAEINGHKLFEDGEEVFLPQPKAKEGYNFEHYKKGDKTYNAGERYKLNGDEVLEAVFTPVSYSLRFYDGTTSLIYLNSTYNITESLELPQPQAKKDHKFVGWYDNSEFNGSPVTIIEENSTGNKEFYSKWEFTGPTNKDKVNEAKDALAITYASGNTAGDVTANVTLPSKGLHDAVITWTTNNANAITNAGAVTRSTKDVVVTLTATIKLGEETATKDFKLTVTKYDEKQEFSIKFNLNGGAWPVTGGSDGYTNRTVMLTDFLTDFYNFVKPSGVSLNDFIHGPGKTSGFDGMYGLYNNETTYFDKLYAANSKNVDSNSEYFINQPQYNKWVALLDVMEEYTSLNSTEDHVQSFWGSPWTGARRIVPFIQGENLWNHIPAEDVEAVLTKIPEALKGKTPGVQVDVPTKYTPSTNDITLPIPEKSGDSFVGWYLNSDFSGDTVTKIVKGSSGNLTLYARWKSSVVPEPDQEYTITYELNGGAFASGTNVPRKYKKTANSIVLPKPTRAGYEFVNWYSTSDLTGTPVSSIAAGSVGNKVFYAKWEAIDTLTDKERAVDAKNALNITFASGDSASKVTKNVTLPVKGMHNAAITWATNNANAVSNAGVVKRANNDVTVTLTATIKVGAATETKTFTLTVLKLEIDPNKEYTLTFNLNGGAWPSGGYKNKAELATAFLTDFRTFIGASDNLNTFMHGAGKTSGFDGTWYSNEEHRAKIYSANVKSGNNSYFLSHSTYQAKWKPFADFMVSFVKVGNPDQDFWSSPYTGNLRIKQYLTNTKPGGAWDDEEMAKMPSGLTAFTPPKVYTPNIEVELPKPTKSGDAFIGWYDNADLWGTAITKIPKNSTGNKVFYARYNSSVQVDPSLSHAQRVAQAKAALAVGYGSGDSATKVTKNVTLRTVGAHRAAIKWTSSDASTISTSGVVSRKTSDVSVTLTATITSGTVSDTKTFTLKVAKIENYKITYHLNGGAFSGYSNKNALATAFLTDFRTFVGASDNLNTFMHGAGKTSGFAGTWFSNEDYRAKIYAANVKSGNNNYFLSSSTYQAKWKPFADFMVNFVKVGNPDQDFWASPYTGNLRMSQYFTNTRPGAAWSDAEMAKMPAGLSSAANEYNPAALPMTLPNVTRSGYTFEGWYTANTGGTKVTSIPAGSTGDKTYYARWKEHADPGMVELMNLLKGGHRSSLSKETITYYGGTSRAVTQYRFVNRYMFTERLSVNTSSYWLPTGRINHPGYTGTKHWVTIHDTGNINASAAGNAAYMMTVNNYVSWHYTVGNDGIYQSMNENMVAWHAGDGTAYTRFTNTGIAATNPYLRPKMTISGGYFAINGRRTNVRAPGSASQLPVTGLHPVIINGTYHINDTTLRTSQTWAGSIGFDGGNVNSIGIETSVRSTDNIWYTWHKTAKLTADILVRRGLLPDRVVFHNTFDGKSCPQTAIRSGNINEWLELIFLEYKVRRYYNNYTITFTPHSSVINNLGRVVNYPSATTNVGYTITIKAPNGATMSERLTTTIRA